jgi:hypothetical protein
MALISPGETESLFQVPVISAAEILKPVDLSICVVTRSVFEVLIEMR